MRTACLIAALALAGACSAPARPATPTPITTPVVSAAPGAGMKAYRDPVTGAFGEPPAGAAPAPAKAQVATRPAPLTIMPAPGGGTMVKLDARFRSMYRATGSKNDGGVRAACATP